jgi:murein DD-endopeptidase MepM/ murein hydrolase activator NlpD
LHYSRISSPFGERYHPILKRKKMHNGVDFAAPHGTAVWACKAGTVVIAQNSGANGNLVIIKHEDNLSSYYAHLGRFAPGIKSESKVRERQVIGYVGSSGRSTGPHLHFGLKRGGQFIDPLKYKIQPGRPVPRAYQAELQATLDERIALLDGTPIRPATTPLAAVSETGEATLGEEDLE